MAEIRAFRGWRYAQTLHEQIEGLVSPLFDVISDKQRERLYARPYSSLHLSVPLGPVPENTAAETLAEWRRTGVVIRDPKPCIYVYYQYFYLPNDPVQHIRKGFIAMVKALDYTEKVVLRHENTIPAAVDDRIKLLATTELNSSATHGLYTDPGHRLEPYMDEAMQRPLFTIEDYQGVTDAFAVIERPETIRLFTDTLRDKSIILADGHHRYESSVQYRHQRMEQQPNSPASAPFHYHMMYFSNTEGDNLRILPTHRLISQLPKFSITEMEIRMRRYFDLKPVDNPECLGEVIAGKPHTFGWVLPDRAYVIRLKKGLEQRVSWRFPEVVKKLDLTVLHYFAFEKVLGIKGRHQRSSAFIGFERKLPACLAAVEHSRAQMAFITNGVGIEQVKQVCYSGHTLPQKSTFFYPKVIAGFVFADISGTDL